MFTIFHFSNTELQLSLQETLHIIKYKPALCYKKYF